jgi:hypothetical protein
MNEVMEVAQKRKNLTATGTLPGARSLIGILVGPVAGGTIAVSDGQGNILNTITPQAGQFLAMPVRVSGTLTITLTGSIDVTAFYS